MLCKFISKKEQMLLALRLVRHDLFNFDGGSVCEFKCSLKKYILPLHRDPRTRLKYSASHFS